ncbi:hypothetical protein M8J77_003475 [Diaphorina citri]|nr:hypothetical protein M8J77_003475 [Diaphorina citri]
MFAEINHFRPYGGSSANWPHCHQQWTACGGHYPGPHPNPPPPKRYILADSLEGDPGDVEITGRTHVDSVLSTSC